MGVVPCGSLAYPEKDTPEGREAAYRASFDLKVGWSFNVFLDSLILHHYDDSASDAFKRFTATIDPGDWDMMETPDYLGLNIYQGFMVNEQGEEVKRNPGFPLTACKWGVTPEVLHYGPMHIYRRYGLPIYITENGLSCNDKVYLDGKVHDLDRIDFLHRYLLELGKAIEEGTPIRGYLQWSFLDNFEWSSGYEERFGIVYVDYRTCERIPKDSAAWYADVIATNGENL